MYDDDIACQQNNSEDLWIYDKLILSHKLGYNCGPVGMDVPAPGAYIVRPCVNLMGMGRDAKFFQITQSTDHLPIGHFWCEIFHGRHLTVDYVDGQQVDCFEGIRSSNELHRWDRWERVNDTIPYPPVIGKTFKYVNCEFIGGKLIEVHLRLNPDATHGSSVLIPVWKGQSTEPPEGMRYIEDPDFHRVGFFIDS